MNWRLGVSALVCVAVWSAGCTRGPDKPLVGAASSSPATHVSPPEKLNVQHLPNAYRIHPKVISGGLPDGEAGFLELESLGVKSVISVDGATPEVQLAKRHGMRYVHMPHGYDGIPEQRARELARAVRELEGPIYIHCHHGKHRSPAAATVACVTAGLLPHDSAAGILKAAGTSPNYRGLYAAAETARPFDTALLDQLNVDYPEIAPLPPIAEAMVNIEHRHDQLQELAKSNWRPAAGKQTDVHQDAAHEALLLKEGFVELARLEVVQKKPARFRELLTEGERASSDLEQALLAWKSDDAKSPPPPISDAMKRVTKNCTACHVEFRDVPLSQK
jgi:protein tyrosine phosphatase (PTP) superfamily phosphohydrolase (DUF442 family)